MFSFKRSRRGTRRHAATGDSTYPDVERRQGIRRPAFCFVEIRGADGTVLIDASIRELSAFGAQLRLQSALRLPERLIIRSVSDMTANTATLRWMSGVSVGGYLAPTLLLFVATGLGLGAWSGLLIARELPRVGWPMVAGLAVVAPGWRRWTFRGASAS